MKTKIRKKEKINPQLRKAEAFEQLKALRIKTKDFDQKKERDSYLEDKYGL